MSTNMDGPDALIQEVLELPVEDLQTLLVTVFDKLRPLATLLSGIPDLATFNVEVTSFTMGKKIQAIKGVRSVTSLGLKEAKDIIDAVDAGNGPQMIIRNLIQAEAEAAVRVLQADGVVATIVR